MAQAFPLRFSRRVAWTASLLSSQLAAQESSLTAEPLATASQAEEAPDEQPAIVAPQFLRGVAVKYPESEEGDAVVSLKLRIEDDGSVAEALVVKGERPFSTLAQEAALAWHFSPATVDGTSKAAWILFRVEFTAPAETPSPPVMVVEEAPPQEEEDTGHEEVLIVSVQGVRTPGSTRMMSDNETTIIPGAEGDPIRALTVLPGIVPLISSGPFVGLRGASSGMVGYEYDGIEVPYLFHLAGGTSVVHPWLVKSATIYGTEGPARFGRSGSGMISASAAEPEGRARVSARVRITDAALGLEAPFAEGRGSVLLAGRYSYMKPLVSLVAPEFSLDYWDYQGRVRYDLQPESTVELLSFGSGDRSAISENDGSERDLFHASFHRTALRYTHRSKESGQDRVGLSFGHDSWEAEPSRVQPFLNSMSLRLDSKRSLGERSWFDYGGDLGLRFQTDYHSPDPNTEVQAYDRTDVASAGWFDWTFRASSRTTLSLGLRLDVYASGPSPQSDKATDLAPQPRQALSHHLSDWARLHQSFGLSAQLPSRTQRPPGRMVSVDGGLERSALSDVGIEWSLPAGVSLDTTAFHNVYFNVYDVRELSYLDGQAADLERGQGRSLGMELSLRRTFAERLRGFVSYTFTHAWRSVGRASAEIGRPHVFDMAVAYYFGKGWDLSARAKYYTGYLAQVSTVDELEDAPRATSYYQVDWQVTKRWKVSDRGQWWGITMGVLNTTLNSESNNFDCQGGQCEEEFVGPATIPTIGVEGEL